MAISLSFPLPALRQRASRFLRQKEYGDRSAPSIPNSAYRQLTSADRVRGGRKIPRSASAEALVSVKIPRQGTRCRTSATWTQSRPRFQWIDAGIALASALTAALRRQSSSSPQRGIPVSTVAKRCSALQRCMVNCIMDLVCDVIHTHARSLTSLQSR